MSILRELRGNQSDLRKVRLSVCVPCKDMVHAGFAFDLCKMMEYNKSIDLASVLHFSLGTLIVNQREVLVKMARDAGSTHILWLDSDMMFPPDTAQRLLKHSKPVVAGNYSTRTYPHKTVAYSKIYDWKSYLINDTDKSGELIPVEAVGMGCMLTSMEVFDKMDVPYFNTIWNHNTGDHLGEDFSFCQKAKWLGHDILIDNDLSMKLKHLGTFAFSMGNVSPGEQ